jgi:hypothetical protein
MFRALACAALAALVPLAACATQPAAPSYEINPNPTAGFEPGAPPQMRAIAWMQGEWDVRSEFHSLTPGDDSWTATGVQRVTYAAIFDGSFLSASYTVRWPSGSYWSWSVLASYDRFQNVYRLAVWDDQWALLDIYEADLSGDVIEASNEESRTWGPGGPNGEMIPARFRITREAEGFRFEWLGRATNGEWNPLIRFTHRPVQANP